MLIKYSMRLFFYCLLVFSGGLSTVQAGIFDKKPKALETLNLSYGKHEKQVLDLVHLEGAKDCPVILFFHGGSWRWGRKDYHRAIGKQFAKAGVVFATANYRLYPEVRFPAFPEDAVLAVKWLRDNVAKYGGDPKKIFLMGHSSGAHSMALVGLDESYLKKMGGDFSWIKGVIAMSCPYYFDPSKELLYRDVFDVGRDHKEFMPLNHVDGVNEPPFLVMHGFFDPLVAVERAEAFIKKVRAAGGRVTRKIYSSHGHFSLVRRTTSWHIWPKPFLNDVVGFVHEHE
jgi:acetyl esterase/lipase